jgi:gamma-glutamylcyclotransferase (GGCT)/AIG2-like uncharacterized protein YtfP
MKGIIEMMLAVYGTLKSGFTNNILLGGSTYIGTDTLEGYKMYDLGFFPGVLESDNPEDTIEVELWDIDEATLRGCDRLEGYVPDWPESSLFLRKETDEGHIIYIFNDRSGNLLKDDLIVKDGNWTKGRFGRAYN